jgi:penicillin-binding protein 1A
MFAKGWLSSDALSRAINDPVPPLYQGPVFLGEAPHYVEHVKQLLIAKYGEEKVLAGGLSVHTGIDAQAQQAAHRALRTGLEELARRHGYPGAAVQVDSKRFKVVSEALHKAFVLDVQKQSNYADSPKAAQDYVWDLQWFHQVRLRDTENFSDSMQIKKLAVGERVTALVSEIDNKAGVASVDLGGSIGKMSFKSLKWARPYHPQEDTRAPRQLSDILKKGDVIAVDIKKITTLAKKPRLIEVELVPVPKVEGALVSIDPYSREVRAMVGGSHHT